MLRAVISMQLSPSTLGGKGENDAPQQTRRSVAALTWTRRNEARRSLPAERHLCAETSSRMAAHSGLSRKEACCNASSASACRETYTPPARWDR